MPFVSNQINRGPEHADPGPFKPIPQTYGSTATVTSGARPVLVAVEAQRPVVMLATLLSTGAGSWAFQEGNGRAIVAWTLTATAGTRQSVQLAGETVRISFNATAAGTATAGVASFI
jgi:hypothetical protein